MRFMAEIESQYTKLYQLDGDRRKLLTKGLASFESSLGNWETSRGIEICKEIRAGTSEALHFSLAFRVRSG